MDLSVIIVTSNSGRLLLKCLESIYTKRCQVSCEVVVVDNGSVDGTIETAEEAFPDIAIIRNGCNLGFTAANNLGVRHSTGRHLLFLNPDTELIGNSLETLVDFMDRRKDVGIVGAKLLNPDGSAQMSCRAFPALTTPFFGHSSLLTRLFPGNKFSSAYLLSRWDHTESRDVDWVSGACIMARRAMLDQIGPFDERFFMYCEDTDLCLRAWKTGWKVHYLVEAQVIHDRGQGGSHRLPYRTIVEHHKSMWRYYLKHLRRNLLFDLIIFGGIICRCATTMTARIVKTAGRKKQNQVKPFLSGQLPKESSSPHAG